MGEPEKIIPLGKHFGWSNQEAASAGDAVKQMRESEGWQRLMEGIESHLRHEQRAAMVSAPGVGEAARERQIGRWHGIEQIKGLAEAIVLNGDEARREMQEVA